MCFSASASFGTAALLFATGGVTTALAQTDQERPFAAIPLLFGIQQFIEGLIWMGLGRGDAQLAGSLAFLYSLFSHLVWPVYMPWATLRAEPPGRRRSLIVMARAASLVLTAYLAFSLWSEPITVQVCAGHLAYAGARQDVFGPWLMLAYVAATCGSLMLSSHQALRAFGVAVLVSLGLTVAIYDQWVISIWCFFAALLSFILLFHFIQPAWRSMRTA